MLRPVLVEPLLKDHPDEKPSHPFFNIILTHCTLWDGTKFFPSRHVSHWWMASTASFLDLLHTNVLHFCEKFYRRRGYSKVGTVTANL